MIRDIRNSGRFADKSFVDVGCGIPVISQTMKELGCKTVAGLEFNDFLVQEAKTYYPDVEMQQADMLTFPDYGKYDILYSYNPLSSGKMMIEALCHIIENMKIGAVFYFNNFMVEPKKLIKS